jgi:seryl-tRNA synthetase
MSEQEKAKQHTEDENISKIRDILFGNNISEIDKRFHDQEALLRRNSDKIAEDFQAKINHLQDHFQNEINDLNKQLKADREENKRIHDQLFAKIDELWSSLNEFKQETSDNNRDIRKTQLEQFNQINTKLTETDKEIKNILENNTRQLTEAKVDRKSLALMFSELALKLNGGEEEEPKA